MSEPGAACPRFGKLIGGCRFEPRYDRGASILRVKPGQRPIFEADAVQGRVDSLLALAEQYRPQYYVRDVCIRCGRTVEREGQADGVG